MGKVSYPVYKESLKVNMPPSGLAIIIGAGPNTGTGIARILSHPKHGNLAVALLARRHGKSGTVCRRSIHVLPGSVEDVLRAPWRGATFSDGRKEGDLDLYWYSGCAEV